MSYRTNSKKHASALKQLNNYVNGINANGFLNDPKATATKGTKFNPNGLVINDPFDSNKVIKFYTYDDDPGMIYYDSLDREKPNEDLKVVPEPKTSEIWDALSGFFAPSYRPNGIRLPNGLPPLGDDKGNGGLTPFPIPIPKYIIP